MSNTHLHFLRIIFAFFIVYAVVFYFSSRYKISLPSSSESCLNADFYLIDLWDTDYERGDLVAFGFPSSSNPHYQEDTPFIKQVVAVSGDTVNVTPEYTSINSGPEVKLSMRYALQRLKMSDAEVTKTIVVPEGTFFGMGETQLSYDSRYWGVIPEVKIIGKVYAIL